MLESSHTPEHVDHEDPANELQRLLDRGEKPPRQWEDAKGYRWVYDRVDTDQGPLLTLTLLDQDASLLCQSSCPDEPTERV